MEEAVLQEFEAIAERGGVLGAMETGYQRGKIQKSRCLRDLKHDGTLPIIGVNTFRRGTCPSTCPTVTAAPGIVPHAAPHAACRRFQVRDGVVDQRMTSAGAQTIRPSALHSCDI